MVDPSILYTNSAVNKSFASHTLSHIVTLYNLAACLSHTCTLSDGHPKCKCEGHTVCAHGRKCLPIKKERKKFYGGGLCARTVCPLKSRSVRTRDNVRFRLIYWVPCTTPLYHISYPISIRDGHMACALQGMQGSCHGRTQSAAHSLQGPWRSLQESCRTCGTLNAAHQTHSIPWHGLCRVHLVCPSSVACFLHMQGGCQMHMVCALHVQEVCHEIEVCI
jgi:hypothetical protein